MAKWIISDTHFRHNGIIEKCNRPFQNTEEMDRCMIQYWNSIVKPDDVVYHLGDVCFSSKEYLEYIVSKLNGYKILILGNHDKDRSKNPQYWIDRGFDEAYKTPIRIKNLILSHEPVIDLSYDEINLHGHIHNTDHTRIQGYTEDKHLNISVELHGYKPISLDQIIEDYCY